MQDLNAQLLQAHEADDHNALVSLYAQVADQCEAAQDVEATCFYLTQAFVFALDSDHPEARELNRRLVAYGREVPL